MGPHLPPSQREQFARRRSVFLRSRLCLPKLPGGLLPSIPERRDASYSSQALPPALNYCDTPHRTISGDCAPGNFAPRQLLRGVNQSLSQSISPSNKSSKQSRSEPAILAVIESVSQSVCPCIDPCGESSLQLWLRNMCCA